MTTLVLLILLCGLGCAFGPVGVIVWIILVLLLILRRV